VDFASLRAKYPGYSDDEILAGLQASKYPDYSVDELKDALGWKPIKRNAFAAVNDTVIEGANAVAGGVKAVGDFIAPGNRFSAGIDEHIIKAGEAKQSDEVKAEKSRLAREVQQADGIGGEIGATLGYIGRNPVLSAAQAAGSFVTPGVAIKGAGMIGGGARAALAGGVAAGAALSGGDAAGQAYEQAIKAGATEEQAQAAARQASLIPAAVGGATGAFGAERIFAGGKGFAGGAAARALKTGVSEAGQEALEEGITQYEAQRAVMPYDASIDPMKGVASAATMGAALGGITGAGVSLATKQNPAAAVPDILTAPDLDTAIDFATEGVFGDSKKEPTTSPGAKGQGEGIPFESDPLFAGKPVIGPAESPLPAFGSKQAADIWIGQSDGLGKYQAVQAGDRWQVTLTPQAADETARQNIDRWAARATPMTEDDARWTARAALQQENRKLTPIPLPDGAGWTVVPSAWVQSPGLQDYIEQGSAAAAVELDRHAAIRAEVMAPAQGLPVLPGGGTMERTLGNIALDADRARAEAQKAADLERMPADVADQNVQQDAVQRAATLEGESPLAAALRKARTIQPTQAAPSVEAAPAAAAPDSTQAAEPEPRIVERTPDMRPMSRLGAEQQAAKIPGAEVVRIPNRQPGKFAYTVITPEAQPSGANVAGDGSAGPADAGRGDGTAGVPEQRPGDVQLGAAGTAGTSVGGIRDAGVPRGDEQRPSGALTAGATFEQNGRAWTVTEATERMVRAQDAEGNKRMIAVGSKAYSEITAAAAAPVNAAVPEQSPAHVGVSSGAPSAPLAAAPVPAVKRRLFVERGDQRIEVDSLEDAQAKWEQFRDKSGAGVSQIGNGLRILDQDGKFVARISYNGRLHDTEDAGPAQSTTTPRSADAVAAKDSGRAPSRALDSGGSPAAPSLGDRLTKRKTDLAAEVARKAQQQQRIDALQALRSCLDG
jgi:hypothetical protein